MTTFNRSRVLITRGGLAGDESVADVFDHEIPVLLQAFGQGNVRADESTTVPPAELDDGIDGEHARLLRKYRRPDSSASPAGIVYPSASDLARALGVPYSHSTANAVSVNDAVQYDGAAEADAEPKPRRGRPPKVDTGE